MPDRFTPVLDEWLRRFRGPLVGLLASWGADWGIAEELAMDTFAEAWIGRERLQGDPLDSRVVGPWLRGIAANLHRSHRRKVMRTRLQPLAAESMPHAAAEPEASDPDQNASLQALRVAFGRLRSDQQTLLRMFYLEEASVREVAALLGLSEKAVESRLYQARKVLRDRAERERAILERSRS